MAEANTGTTSRSIAGAKTNLQQEDPAESYTSSSGAPSKTATSPYESGELETDVPSEPAEPPAPDGKALKDYTPDEINQGLQSGTVSMEGAKKYVSYKTLSNKGLMGMSPKEVKWGYESGVIPKEEAEKYHQKKTNPIGYYASDVAETFAGAFTNMVENNIETAGAISEYVLPINKMVYGEAPDYGEVVDGVKKSFHKQMPWLADRMEEVTSPESTPAKIAQPFLQFGMSLTTLGKFNSAFKAGKLTDEILKTPAMARLGEKYPKTAQWLSRTSAETLRGGWVDQTAFDPDDPHLADALLELGIENEGVQWLASGPGDTEGEARVKMGIESLLTGFMFDGVLEGLRATKYNMLRKRVGQMKLLPRDAQATVGQRTGVDIWDEPHSHVKGLAPNTSSVDETAEGAGGGGKTTDETTEGVGGVGKATDTPAEESPQKKIKDAFMESARREDGSQKSNVKIADVKRKAKEKGLSDEEATETIKSLRDDGEIELTAGYDPQLFSQQDIEDTKPFTEEASGRYVMKRGSAWEDPIDEASEGATSQRPTEGNVDGSQKTGQGPEEGSSKATTDVQKGDVLSEEEKTDRSIQLFSDMANMADDSIDDRFINKVEEVEEQNAARLLRAVFSKNNAEIEAGRNRPKPWSQTDKEAHEALAGATNEDPSMVKDALQTLWGDVKDLDTKIHMFSQFVTNYSKGLDEFIYRNFDEKGRASVENELKAVQHMKHLQEMMHALYGIRTEMGRGLNAMKMSLDDQVTNKFDFDNIDKETLEAFPAEVRYKIRDQIKLFREARTSAKKAQVAKVTGKLQGSRLPLEGLLAYTQANLLWGPDTHFTNLMGGGLAILNNSLKKGAAASVDRMVHGSGPMKDRAGAVLREGAAQAYGMTAGPLAALRVPGLAKKHFKNPSALAGDVKQAWRDNPDQGLILRALFEGDPQLDKVVKMEGQMSQSFLEPGTGQTKSIGNAIEQNFEAAVDMNMVPGYYLGLGKMLSLPFHGLTAGDELMRHIGYFGELHRAAAEDGISKGLKGKDLNSWIENSVKKPTPALHQKAQYNGRDVTFTHPLPKGGPADYVNRWSQTKPGIVGKITAMPFYRVIINLTKYAGKNSPLGYLSKNVRNDIKAGGRTKYETIAGMVGGFSMLSLGFSLYQTGHLTGHIPSEFYYTAKEKGEQAYSLKVGNKHVSTKRADPLAYVLNFGADLGQTYDMAAAQLSDDDMETVDEEVFKTVSVLLGGIKGSFLDKTMMRSVEKASEFFMGPERMDIQEYLGRTQAEKFVPFSTGLSDYQRQIADDMQREVDGFMDMVQQKLDQSKLRATRHTVYSTKKKAEEAYPFPTIGVFTANSSDDDDPVIEELYDLGVSIRPISDQFQKDRTTISYDDEQLTQLHDIIAGWPVKETLTRIIQSPGYQNIKDPKTKGRILKQVISEFRMAARDKLLGTHEGFRESYLDKAMERVRSITTEPGARESEKDSRVNVFKNR